MVKPFGYEHKSGLTDHHICYSYNKAPPPKNGSVVQNVKKKMFKKCQKLPVWNKHLSTRL